MDLDRWMSTPPPFPRRRFLRGAAAGAMGLSLASILAACEGARTPARGSLPPLAGRLRVAQWPRSIDRSTGGTSPTLRAFRAGTGVETDFREVVVDDGSWYDTMTARVSAGRASGWDLMGNAGWFVHRFLGRGALEPLHPDALPTARANLASAFRDPPYDPGNAHSLPWQGGITGIAYHPDLTGEITHFEDLWSPSLEGRVGMLAEMVDTMTLTLRMLGVDPQEATLDDARRAQSRLLEQRDARIVRAYYGRDYIQALVGRDVWASMAWSGDIFYWKHVGGAPSLEFVVPAEGGLIWANANQIPLGALHPTDAHAFMDFYYRPEIAAQLTDWVLRMTPVQGVQDLMREKARSSSGEDRRYYEALAESQLLFPPEDPSAANLHQAKAFSDEEYAAYQALFDEVVAG